MHIIKADHHRTLSLAGVPEPVYRPVDVDRTQTGFSVLRSLRIYRFDAGSVIDGHAEEDEVLMVILRGSVQLTMSEHDLGESSPRFSLSAAGSSDRDASAAYLPPNGAYRLVPLSDAEVAYARATTSRAGEPTVFSAKMPIEDAGERVLLEETNCPVHLRLRIVEVRAATRDGATVMPLDQSDSTCEALVHVRTEPQRGAATISAAGMEPTPLESWDTVALLPEERPTLRLAGNSSALLLVISASCPVPALP